MGVTLCPALKWRMWGMGSAPSPNMSSIWRVLPLVWRIWTDHHGLQVLLGITNSSNFSQSKKGHASIWDSSSVSGQRIIESSAFRSAVKSKNDTIDSWNSHQKTLLKHLTWCTSQFETPFFPALWHPKKPFSMSMEAGFTRLAHSPAVLWFNSRHLMWQLPIEGYGCFLKWWYPPISTPKCSFLVGKPNSCWGNPPFFETPISWQIRCFGGPVSRRFDLFCLFRDLPYKVTLGASAPLPRIQPSSKTRHFKFSNGSSGCIIHLVCCVPQIAYNWGIFNRRLKNNQPKKYGASDDFCFHKFPFIRVGLFNRIQLWTSKKNRFTSSFRKNVQPSRS